jgi:methionyl-tRNA synthetase
VPPRSKGIIRITPRRAPASNDVLGLEFLDPWHRLTDCYRLQFAPTKPPPWPTEASKPSGPANDPSPALSGTLSPSDGERDGVRGDDELSVVATTVARETHSLLEQNQLQAALQNIWSLVTRANQYVDQTAPFKLAKDPAQSQRLDEVLYNLTETCRVLAVLLQPFLPGTSAKIYAQLGLTETPDKFSEADWGKLNPGHKIGEPAPLFPRKDN